MTTYEALGTAQLAENEQEEIALALGKQAQEMAEHWEGFADGREHRFLAYFMRNDAIHEVMLELFLDNIQATTELPGKEKQAVIKSGRAILWAYSNTDENDQPFDVMYVGERIEPVQ